MKKSIAISKKKGARVALAAAVLLLVALAAFPFTAYAADTEIHSIEVTASLREDGSAQMTEVWDVNAIGDMAEWYIAKPNHGNNPITNLSVIDETGQVYETVDNWDVDGSIEEKAGKCGILATDDGYELCWGIGSFGAHTYTVTYEIANLVQGLTDADALSYTFIEGSLSSAPEYARVTVRREGVEFTSHNTGVWAFGDEGIYVEVRDGVVVAEAENGLGSRSVAALLLEFNKGMFAPVLTQDIIFGDALEQAKQGSNYGDDYDGDGDGFFSGFGGIASIAIVIGIILAFTGTAKKRLGSTPGTMGQMKKEYREANYARELPYEGSLPATYSRLEELRQLPNEGTVIGAYFLRWIRSRQVEITTAQSGGLFGNKEETAIRLFDARPEMDAVERSLYDMVVRAAGRDYVLQSKEFEKWSKKNYSTVQAWLERYKNIGKSVIRQQGGIDERDEKTFFGLGTARRSYVTEKGDALTISMFGFKKYLEEFTIINERQAREVQLWDEYLVFAQVFGIAEKVAEQFEKLYPDYFVQMAQDIGMRPDLFDLMIITHMANNFGRAMNDGYRAGYDAHVSRDSGGGGWASGGGGFTSFGGGSFGGGGGGGGGGR